MKKVKIVYNPYLLTTNITVDGKKPAANSSLGFYKQRLQEWAEKLPKILLDEYRDKNITIDFTGTQDDFDDLKIILTSNNLGMNFSNFAIHRTPDVEEVEEEVLKIWKDIKNGPVSSLKDDYIKDAFDDALSTEFAINVVATMSSGKSSLINALLGNNLMPVASMATTATIVRIIATEQEGYSGIAYDANGNEVTRDKSLTPETLEKWNESPKISTVNIYGRIPCVDSIGMRLVLVDTPGPNNSRNENHKKLTYKMLQESEKSLVLFVMNASQLNIDNEAEFLDYVCKCMKEGGKQSRDRFIFAVNKLDTFKPKDGDKVEVALDSVREGLDARDIKGPNIFPISALAALEIRTDDDDPSAIDTFRRRCAKGTEFHFETYYPFNHLPTPSRNRVNALATENDETATLLVHTGIPSIEEAIRLYVNKYARTIKVKDLVDAFNQRLTELKAEAELHERIQQNINEKARLENEIATIQHEITSGNAAIEYASLIDSIDVSEEINRKIDDIVGQFQARIDTLVTKYSNETKVFRDRALSEVKKLQDEAKDIYSQLPANISAMFEKSFKLTYDKIMTIYREKLSHLSDVTFSFGHSFEFNPLDFIAQDMSDVEYLIKKNTQTYDEGYDEKRTRRVKGERKTNWIFAPWTWGSERYEYKNEEYTVHIPREVEYVNMKTVADNFFVPLQKNLITIEKEVPEQIDRLAQNLKEGLKEELAGINSLLNAKLQQLRENMNSAYTTQAQIAEQKKQLAWMRQIVDRVNKLINY